MTLAESKGGRPRRSFASCARCATWQPPECDQYDPDVSSSLRPYLDLDHDPPAALILTDDVRSIAEPSLAERSPEPMPPWSRLDQRPPQDGSLPVAAPAAALAGATRAATGLQATLLVDSLPAWLGQERYAASFLRCCLKPCKELSLTNFKIGSNPWPQFLCYHEA